MKSGSVPDFTDFEAEHIEHRHFGEHDAVQVGTLLRNRGDEQAAVRPPRIPSFDGEV